MGGLADLDDRPRGRHRRRVDQRGDRPAVHDVGHGGQLRPERHGDPRGVRMDRLETHPQVADERRALEEFAHELRPGWQTRAIDVPWIFDFPGYGEILGHHRDHPLTLDIQTVRI